MFPNLQNEIENYIKFPNNQENYQILFNSLLSIYKDELKDSLTNILNINEKTFMSEFLFKMFNLLSNYLTDNSLVGMVENIKKEIFKIFKEIQLKCKETYNKKNKISEEEIKKLNYIKHCLNDRSEIATHICGGNFLPVFSSSENNKNPEKKIDYLICNNCKQVYDSKYILMFCSNCKINYYSYAVKKSDMITPPATWKKYHCNLIMNEQMHCINCNELFYLNKYGDLYCKKCKYSINPLDISWKCVKCQNFFKTEAKIYNPLDFKVFKDAVKNAIINKEKVFPVEIKCCGIKNLDEIKKLNFKHNKNCEGNLYLGILNDKKILVCGKCAVFCSIKKYEWVCPLCGLNFVCNESEVFSEKEKKNMLIDEIVENQSNENPNLKNMKRNYEFNQIKANNINTYNIKSGINKGNLYSPQKIKNIQEINSKEQNKKYEIKSNNILDFRNKINNQNNNFKLENNENNNEYKIKSEKIDQISFQKNKKFEILNDVKISDIKFINKINDYLGNVEYKKEKFGYVEIKNSKLTIFKQYFNYFKQNYTKINLNHYLKIYSFFDNNKILTEPIESLLNDELENKKIYFNYMQIETILFNITLPLKNYVEKFEQNYIISTSHIFRVNEEDFKFCPFIHDIDSNNYGMTKNVEILAFIILDMALRNFEMIDELQQIYDLKAKEIFTKTLRSILKGKVSEITTKTVIKMLNDKKNVASLEEIYNFLKE